MQITRTMSCADVVPLISLLYMMLSGLSLSAPQSECTRQSVHHKWVAIQVYSARMLALREDNGSGIRTPRAG